MLNADGQHEDRKSRILNRKLPNGEYIDELDNTLPKQEIH